VTGGVCLAPLFSGWEVLADYRDHARGGHSVHLFVSDRRLREARSAVELAHQLAPVELSTLFKPRRYTGRYAPRAAMRRRAGL
jgi:hypothetical protein